VGGGRPAAGGRINRHNLERFAKGAGGDPQRLAPRSGACRALSDAAARASPRAGGLAPGRAHS
jgi:hypothetical protein